MKDITHYFQIPEKSRANNSDTQILKSRNDSKISISAREEDWMKSTEKPESSSKPRKGDENMTNGKKRKDSDGYKQKKSKKRKIASSEDSGSESETSTVPQTKSADSSKKQRSKVGKKIRKGRKKLNVEKDNDTVYHAEVEPENEANVRVLKAVILEDCMVKREKSGVPVNDYSRRKKGKTDNVKRSKKKSNDRKSDAQDSDLEDCVFVSSDKKKATKSKIKEESRRETSKVEESQNKASKMEEPQIKTSKKEQESPGNTNSLFNYFNKVTKTENERSPKKLPHNLIKVQAVIHSPPKDRSKLRTMNRHAENKSIPAPVEEVKKSSRGRKKKVKSLDEIEVVSVDEIQLPEESANTSKSKAPETPLTPLVISASSKVTPWRMRVKLTPNSKFDESITSKTRTGSAKSSDCEGENSDNDVEFVSVIGAPSNAPKIESHKKEPTKSAKLAPLFCKIYNPKTAQKQHVQVNEEARRLFLESGVPEQLKKKMEESKSVAEGDFNCEYIFPKDNHIQQKDALDFNWNLTEVLDLNYKLELDDTSFVDDILSTPFSFKTKVKKSNPTSNALEKCEIDIKNEVSSLKKLEPNVNVSDLCSSIKRLHKVSENISADICWTDKYNPTIFQDMIGNANSLLKLKEWVESHKRIRLTYTEDEDSSDGFIHSDDSLSSETSKNNIAILVGPPGCGKTSAVYMVANELGFEVLEVNAGSNRNGKRLLDELLEATQSHRVKNSPFSDPKAAKKIGRKRKVGKTDKWTKKDKKTMSLILIEDVDILLDNHDGGFLSALNSLAAMSKRPLIFTANNLNYPHLHKYNNLQNIILRFTYPPRSTINVWLRLIALFEGAKLADEVLMNLFTIAGSDLRKSLLQLQMLISSKFRFPKFSKQQLFYNDWWNSVELPSRRHSNAKISRTGSNGEKNRPKLFSEEEEDADEGKPENDSPPVQDEKVETDSSGERLQNIKHLCRSAKLLSMAAILNAFEANLYDQRSFPLTDRSFCEYDDTQANSLVRSDICDYIKDSIFNEFQEKMSQFSFRNYCQIIRGNCTIKSTAENVFACIGSKIATNTTKYCDYLPAIRDIARFERSKGSGNVKRSNRYFGYLKSVNIDISDKETDILCRSFL